MKRLVKLVLGVVSLYVAYLLVSHYLRRIRAGLDEQTASAPPRQNQSVTQPTQVPPLQQEYRLNLNKADVSALIALPGIGPKLAELVAARRREIGAFTTLDELTQVNGIGSTLVGRLRPLVTLN